MLCTCSTYLLSLVEITDAAEEATLLLLEAKPLHDPGSRGCVRPALLDHGAEQQLQQFKNPPASETMVVVALNNATHTGLKFQAGGDKAKSHFNRGCLCVAATERHGWMCASPLRSLAFSYHSYHYCDVWRILLGAQPTAGQLTVILTGGEK